MSDTYVYTPDNSLIIQDRNIIWNESPNQSLQFVDANDTIIADESTINESYATAIDSNETQYLSILESSNDITLEDLNNLTIGDGEIQQNVDTEDSLGAPANGENSNGNDEEGTQIIVFTMDGSEDLYGIQFAQDDQGNIQKYQFKFRTTEDGQLEAIPESVQLLPNENDSGETEETQSETQESEAGLQESDILRQYLLQPQENGLVTKRNEDTEHESDNNVCDTVYIKGECLVDTKEHTFEGEINDNSETEEPHGNIKLEILEASIQTNQDNYRSPLKIKQENSASQEENEHLEYLDEQHYFEDDHFEQKKIYQDSIENHAGQETSKEATDSGDRQDLEEESDEISHSKSVFNENFAQYNEDNTNAQYESYESDEGTNGIPNYYSCEKTLDGKDKQQYQYVEELQISEGLNIEPQEQIVTTSCEPIIHEVIEADLGTTLERTNILKHPIVNVAKESKMKKASVGVKYYVLYPEKENVHYLQENLSIPGEKHAKTNPRSVLRNSFSKPRMPETKPKSVSNVYPQGDIFHKRFAKSKEAMRAKQFHNFINRTTIPQAPVRQKRLPRKQEIKPVIERRDEEIIVQEVMVSSNGFIETINDKVKNSERLQVTAVVELTDSEEESSSKQKSNRRKTTQVIRPDSDSENDVIEIHSDEELVEDQTDFVAKRSRGRPKKPFNDTSLKRRRGRPPKINKSGELATIFELSPRKKSCKENVETDINAVSVQTSLDKKEIVCPHCPKTFPSQNSLNTHIIHHNLENSLKNKGQVNSRASLIPKMEYKHKCNDCQQTFKNTILLQRHNCTKKGSPFTCLVCLKEFRDITLLNIHKKTHAKSNLFKNTSLAQVSPKKALRKSSLSLMKSPKMSTFKCKECPKVCSSDNDLNVHAKTHKKFVCSSCSSTFSSRLLLDTHVRLNCVKVKSPLNRRLSFKIKKSFVHTPPRRQTVGLQFECEVCKKKFSGYRSLYTHKVQEHGLNTPNKSLTAKPKQTIFKPKAAHSGIPANNKMKKAYAALKKKLADAEVGNNFDK